jgi:hypothetical protein
MPFLGITEARTLPQLITLANTETSVTADVAIVDLYGSIENSPITVLTIQSTMEDTGNYYLLDANNKKHYLTNPESSYPAKLQFISTYFMPSGQTMSLCYDKTTTMTDLMIMVSGGVY